jgi:CRISPR-associated protein Cmr2
MTVSIYTAITFAPVQGFIEKSRKLRDLYGSSFILSYLSERICKAAQRYLNPGVPIDQLRWPEDPVVSPALISITQGVPNQILVRGEFPEDQAETAFNRAWSDVMLTCQAWIEDEVPNRVDGTRWEYEHWQRMWQAWINHAWEFFWAVGDSADDAKEALNERKFARAWCGVNWTGESSSLSGIDGRAWPHMGKHRPYSRPQADEDAEVREFYGQLMAELDEATITTREFLSIPELVKRLVTYDRVVNYRPAPQRPRRLQVEIPPSFKDLNRLLNRPDNDQTPIENAERAESENVKRWTGWFQGDGDRAGNFLVGKPDDVLHRFSHNMRQWGAGLQRQMPPAYRPQKLDPDGRIIYAGGDDFLGVFYRNQVTRCDPADSPPMTPLECLNWFEIFKSRVWSQTQEPITVSVGFVWAAPSVPQRDVLQHCREAEQAAKQGGRDRIAWRILFNSGNSLEWICPWWLLEGDFSSLPEPPGELPATGLVAAYRDRRAIQGYDNRPNWTHLYNDVATLKARHAFQSTDVALGLMRLYFGEPYWALLANPAHWFNHDADNPEKTRIFSGVLGDRDAYDTQDDIDQALIDWVIALAQVGFHLTQSFETRSYALAA